MRKVHVPRALVLVFFLVVLSSTLATVNARQPAIEVVSKGNSHLKLLEIAKTLQLNDRILVWIDINATMDRFSNYYLPADPSVYGIKWVTITFAPDINKSKLFWCLAEIRVRDIEKILEIPWVFDITLVKVGGLSNEPFKESKLSPGLVEAIKRAIKHNTTLQIIIWIEKTTNLSKKVSDPHFIMDEIVCNVTTAIERNGGHLLRGYMKGCHTLSALLPAENITEIAENPYVKGIYLNGPVVIYGADNTACLYGRQMNKEHPSFIYGLTVLLITPNILMAKKKTKKNMLVLFVAIILSLTFFSQMIFPAQALDISTSAIRAPDVWATGNRGGGINVAIIDTGIDLNHNDFANAIVDRINIPDGSQNVQDTVGHGTHVAGIVAGRGTQNSIYRGVAWDAGLVIVRVVTNADLEPAVRWVINNSAVNNIRVIQSSVGPADIWGNPILGGDGLEHPYSIAMDDAVEEGIVVVQAAGNSGEGGSRTIASPGNAFNIITVGAIDDHNTQNINDDTLADFSSRGPTGDGRPKPDVVAPGVRIISCRAAGTDIRTIYDTYIDPDYVECTGTSMAAPHVAGTVALMLNANPNLTPAQVKAILRQTARLNDNLNELSVNDRGHGIIDAYAAVQLAQDVNNIDRDQMYDAWDASTPGRDLGWWCYDYLTFSVAAPSSFGISVREIDYHYRHPLGIGNTDYRLLWRLCAQHVWIDGIYYNLGNGMNKYLFSGPRIYEKGGGYVRMQAWYRVGSVRVQYYWYLHVDEMWLWLCYYGGSSWKTLIYMDIDIWDATNYPYLPSADETVLIERKVSGDVLLNVRDLYHTEYVQLDPYSLDDPVMWILRYGYFGNNPDMSTVSNKEYVYNRDLVIYYQGTSSYPGGWIYRKTDPLPAPDPTQNDAGSGGDAGNTFDAATSINPGSYKGILCNTEGDNGNDYYKFYVESGQKIYLSMTPPSGIDFDLQLYDPNGNLKAGSSYGAGYTDSISYTADSSGYWRARIYIFSGEAQYSFYVSVYWPGGGGCPILYVYNGTGYVCEGLLDIHNPEGIDVIYNHTLVSKPQRVNGAYLFKLVEHPQTHSYIDQVRLYAILEDKTLIELPLIYAWHSEDGNVLPQLLFSDDWKTDTLGANLNNGTSQSIDLKFAALSPNMKIIGFIFQIEGNNRIVKR